MESARMYVANFPNLKDSTSIEQRDTVFPPKNGIIPPVTRDTTKIEPGLLQHKEWEDTTYKSIIAPQIRNSWGQGASGIHDLDWYPEGYLFSNGFCGCGPLAVAQACLYFGEPTQVKVYGEYHDLDWSIIKKHKAWFGNIEDGSSYCSYYDKTQIHNMVAWLCRFIADEAEAEEDGSNGTSTFPDNLLNAIKKIFPNRVISSKWNSLNNTDIMVGKGDIMIVRGRNNADKGHVWVNDGSKWFEIDHYYATRENSHQPWTIQTKTHVVRKFNHFNWGWDGLYNGWYNHSIAYLGSNGTYTNYQYILIK